MTICPLGFPPSPRKSPGRTQRVAVGVWPTTPPAVGRSAHPEEEKSSRDHPLSPCPLVSGRHPPRARRFRASPAFAASTFFISWWRFFRGEGPRNRKKVWLERAFAAGSHANPPTGPGPVDCHRKERRGSSRAARFVAAPAATPSVRSFYSLPPRKHAQNKPTCSIFILFFPAL